MILSQGRELETYCIGIEEQLKATQESLSLVQDDNEDLRRKVLKNPTS